MCDGKVLFSLEEDEKLVEMISTFPCVYDINLPLYKDLTVKDNAWREIAEFVERSVDDCKKRWRNIKDTYHKRQKKGKNTRISLSKGKKWPLADLLTFLSKVDRKQRRISDVKDEDTDIEIDDGDVSSRDKSLTPPLVSSVQDISNKKDEYTSLFRSGKRARLNDRIVEFKKSRRLERESLSEIKADEKRDDVDLFFKSIAISVKKLNPNLINEAKMKSLQMLIELENRN